ncbi:hypothetical protein BV25DRAFT_1915055 [Artomyces pyxidatus]|uniref:Uncharacterized protein n=1 Tax=Artomyces pyxidatus TaxID=48021 RepID=A0ACB8T465_9AGAM|nr:hypothetical protein BV25DRAFT_1915055 [Artomyces pyxidatus]
MHRSVRLLSTARCVLRYNGALRVPAHRRIVARPLSTLDDPAKEENSVAPDIREQLPHTVDFVEESTSDPQYIDQEPPHPVDVPAEDESSVSAAHEPRPHLMDNDASASDFRQKPPHLRIRKERAGRADPSLPRPPPIVVTTEEGNPAVPGVEEELPHSSGDNDRTLEPKRHNIEQVLQHWNVAPPPLPYLPPAVSSENWLVNNRQIERFIEPLYQRGWGLCLHMTPELRLVFMLQKSFSFRNNAAVLKYLNQFVEYMAKAKHHATIQFSYNKMLIQAHTHTAYMSKWVRTGAVALSEGNRIPYTGVTMLDVRMAYEAERMFEEAVVEAGTTYTYKLGPRQQRLQNVQEMLQIRRETRIEMQRKVGSARRAVCVMLTPSRRGYCTTAIFPAIIPGMTMLLAEITKNLTEKQEGHSGLNMRANRTWTDWRPFFGM